MLLVFQAAGEDRVLLQGSRQAQRGLQGGRERGGRGSDCQGPPEGAGAVPVQGAVQDLRALLPHELPLQGPARPYDVYRPGDLEVRPLPSQLGDFASFSRSPRLRGLLQGAFTAQALRLPALLGAFL